MPRSPYGPFDQIDFPGTKNSLPGSAFWAKMPVDLQTEAVRSAVMDVIPGNITATLAKHGADYETYISFERELSTPLVRELGIKDAIFPVAEQRAFERNEFLLRALTQRGVAFAQLMAHIYRGELLEYSVATMPADSYADVRELFASVNRPDEPNEYHMLTHLDGVHDKNALTINAELAYEFLAGLVERQTGQRADGDELALLKELYGTSAHGIHTQETRLVVNADKEIVVKNSAIKRGRQSITAYALEITQNLPEGSTITASLRVDPPKRNGRIYPTATLNMLATDIDTSTYGPMDRAAVFESILTSYRKEPVSFVNTLASASAWLISNEAPDHNKKS